jgi:membrane protease YdiL (CAAX protease family)
LILSPAIAAIVTELIFEKGLRGLGWSFKPYRYLAAGYAIPLLYGLFVYGIVWLSGLGIFSIQELSTQLAAQGTPGAQPTTMFLITYSLKTATLGVLFACITAFGEEIGWRGFLVPQLAKRYSFGATALISGIIWSIWHYPAILFVEYNNAGAPLWFGLICFTIFVIGISFIMAWLRLASGSLWPAVLFHASHNAFIQTLFNPLTKKTALSPYVIDEFGLGLAITGVLIGFVIWQKYRVQ